MSQLFFGICGLVCSIVTLCWGYLASNKNRVFVPEKYNSYEEAHRAALRYVPANRLHVKECTGALPPE